MRQPVLALLFDRQHLHRNVAGAGVELEIVEYRPAEHIGQEYIQRDRGRQVFACEGEGLLTTVGDQTFECPANVLFPRRMRA